MSLPKFSIQQPVFVNLFALLIVVIGVFSFTSIPKEELPDIHLNAVKVTTSYPGPSPEEIEELITQPIEEEISDIDDIDYISSITSEGRSVVNVYFSRNTKMDTDDLYRKLQEVQTEVNKVTDLPENADNPEVKEFKIDLHLITIGIVGEGRERELTEIAEDMHYDLKKIYGVSDVIMSGHRKKEIWVEVDPVRLESYGLSLNHVISVLKGRNLNLPGGTIKHLRNEFILRTVGEVKKVKEIENIVIKKGDRGGHIFIKDVAHVSETFKEPTVISKVNGKRGITISVSQGDVGNMVDIISEIKAVAMGYRSRLPAGAEIVFAHDNSLHLEKRLGILYSNGVTGLILVAVSLFFFIGVRPALVTALGIPVAFCGCIFLMDLSGITINSLSLFAMIIVLGMIVDDAIVVTENIYRYSERGMSIREAALRGAQEVFWPVVAAVGTTMAAFLPMLLMTGLLGEFMGIVPKVVIFSLAASLGEAFFILPSHIVDFAKPPSQKKYVGKRSTCLYKLQKVYTTLLRKVLKRRYWAVAILVCSAGLILFTAVATLDFILFPDPDFDTFVLMVKAPESTRIEQTGVITSEAEKFLLELPSEELFSVETDVGQRIERLDGNVEFASNIAEVQIRLTDYQARTRSGQEIMDSLRSKLDTLKNPQMFKLRKEMSGPPVGKPVAVRIMGDDFQILKTISRKVMEELGKIRGVTGIEDDFLTGKEEIRIIVDEERAALFDLNVAAVAKTIQYAYMGGVATEYKDQNDEVDVIVKFDEGTRNDIPGILNMKVQNTAGHMIPLKNAASLEHTSGYTKIRRFDQKRVVNITADIETGENNSRDVIHEIQRRMGNYMEQFPGYILKFGGEYEDTQESLASLLKSFGLALFLIYMILATTFKSFTQPFMLMAAIPFAVIGVFVGLIVMRTPMGMMSFLGIIALAGIVVNDSIVLIDFINRRRAEAGDAGDRMEAIIGACKTRLRPILLTSITTIFGLMPIALGIFGREMWMTPMAISIVWGLTISSILTLFIVPCLYTILEDMRRLKIREET